MANKNKKNSFLLEIGVYMLFFFLYSKFAEESN